MKKTISVLLCVFFLLSLVAFNASATEELTTDTESQTRATGLITSTALSISKSGTTLTISGKTLCIAAVVKCGFKNLVVERRTSSADSWEEYQDCGNIYVDSAAITIAKKITVESGYQYRVTTKHYAKQNIILVQTISNESNIIQF